MNNYQIDFLPVSITFLLINIMIFMAGYFGSKLTSNRKRLESKGYPESYIIFTLNFSNKFGKKYVGLILLLEILFSIISLLVLKRLDSGTVLTYVLMPSIFFSIPFAAYYSTKANKEYKKLAIEEGHDIVVDFQRKNLKLIFNLPIEIAAAIIVSAFAIIFLPLRNSLVIYLYVILPWFFSFILQFTKNYIKPVLKDSYLLIGKMTIIYQSILVFLLIVESIEFAVAGNLIMITGLCTVSAFLIFKIIYYIPRYRKLKIAMSKLV